MSYEIATPTAMQVLKLRQERGELQVQVSDSSYRRLYRVGGYRSFVPDVEESDMARPWSNESGLPVRAGKAGE